MNKMYKGNYYKDMYVSSGFAEDRGAYLHSGIDGVSKKGTEIKILFDGILEPMSLFLSYGIYRVCKTNPKYVGGVNEVFFHSYCHLYEAYPYRYNLFLPAGTVIGTMGNSGKCYTRDINGWRLLTIEEKNDAHYQAGTHLHFSCFQFAKSGQVTKLLKDLKYKKLIKNYNPGNTHFWQWGKLFIAPRIMMSYFKILQGEKL